MKKIMIIWSLMGVLFICTSAVLGQEDIIIQSQLFKGTRADNVAKAAPPVIYASFSGPIVFPMQARSIEDTELWAAALKNDLANIYQLKTVEYLISSDMIWDRKKSSLKEIIMLDQDIYQIFLSPQLLPNDRVSLKIVIIKYPAEQLSLIAGQAIVDPKSRTRIYSDAELTSLKLKTEREKLVLNTEIIMNYDDPAVLGFPSNEHPYFLSLLLKKAKEKEVEGGVVGGSMYFSIKGEDPVCGKQVGKGSGVEEENRAAKVYEYQGKTYLFCSNECFERFKADPAKYIKRDSPPPKEQPIPASADAFAPPRPISKVDPVYPEKLKKDRVEGQVMVEVSTDEKGNVAHVRLLRSLHPDLDKSALEALRQWKFEPVLVNGKPTPVTFTMTVDFK